MSAHRILLAGAATLSLAACEGLPDFDLRDLGNGFDTSDAVKDLPDRPAADDRGIISYPNYQVALAQEGDTIETISQRLGLNASEVAAFNGIEQGIKLRKDELVALPTRVSEPAIAVAAADDVPSAPLNIENIATTALDRAEADQPAPAPAAQTAPPVQTPGVEPIRHKVLRGETVFQISRQYNVPVRNIAEWNSLGPDLLVREGQFLLIPQGGAAAPVKAASAPAAAPVVAPEVTPPTPDPAPTPAPEPDQTSARLLFPVDGTIIKAFEPGETEGILIQAPGGSAVRAAATGQVATVTTDTNGTIIVILRHEDGLLTLYTNLENVTVARNETVARGDNIGQMANKETSILNFQVRRGLQALDPKDFLP